MANSNPHSARLAELETALDTYGADRTRWPVPVRHALSGFIASTPEAQRMLKDAELFDRLIDQAPRVSSERFADLTEKIVKAAVQQPRIVMSGSKPSETFAPVRREQRWAAAALAASLMLGIVAGQTRFVDPAAELLIGSSISEDAGNAAQVAQIDQYDGLLDEDLL
jgi:hypothetical protein